MTRFSLQREDVQVNTPLTVLRRFCLGLSLIVIHSMLSTASFAQAPVSPPLGPTTYRSDKIQIGVGVLKSFVKTKVSEIVVQANETIRQQTKKVTVEALPLEVFSPLRVATRNSNRPNEYYVKLPMIIGVRVKLPLPLSDRRIYIPLDVNFSCEGWETGKGKVQILGRTGPPSIEGGNIFEDVIMVRDLIDSLIRSKLTLPGTISVPELPNPACITIGASPGQTVGDLSAFIAYDQPGLQIAPAAASRALPTVEVTLLRLKRLRARSQTGAILYQSTENFILETYANFTTRQSPVLTMLEDQEVNLNLAPLVVTPRGLALLVVITNIKQQPTSTPEDSAFATSARSANYSPGVHKLQITKVYTVPPGPLNLKPLQIRVPAYELTYRVAVESGPRFARTP